VGLSEQNPQRQQKIPAGNSCRDFLPQDESLPRLKCAQILDDNHHTGDPASYQAAAQYEPGALMRSYHIVVVSFQTVMKV
jgi:hypothetical protein